MSFEFGLLREGRARRGLLPVAAASVLVPFALGIGLGHVSAPIYAEKIPVAVYALFCGVALAITAVPILGRILAEYGMLDHELGVLAISAAAINDIAGWLLLGVVSALASALATASFAPGRSLAQLAGVLGFALVCWFLLRPAAAAALRKYPLVDGEIPPSMMAIVLIAVFILGLCTSSLGIFTIFGGFATGLLLHQDRAFAEAWRKQIGSFVMVFFLPIFFTATGLRTNLLGLTSATDWIWLGVFLATGILGKIIPVYIAGRIAGFDGPSALMLGGLMNTRALMELIVLNIGLETGFLPQKVFTMLVIMAVVTTVMTGPFLRALMPRLGIVITRRIEA
jgi:Kef-type K+ transport system membrane component KefB